MPGRSAVRRVSGIGLVVATLGLCLARIAAAQSASGGGALVSGGGFLWRHLGARGAGWNDGVELAWGPALADMEGAWRFTSLVQMDLRAFATSSWALALSTSAFEVTGRIGPFAPYARVGAAVATVDDFDGAVSAELFSPRVGAGLAVRVGKRVEVGAGVYSEYFWRWFGPSAIVHGILLDLRFERRPKVRQK